jgi:cobalt-zinc-cadmium efflux system membrane fusion protein
VASFERGPHRGRWLEDGGFALELTIFEQGVPPEFRAFVYQSEKPSDPAGVQLEVTLHRLGDRVDHIGFAPRGEYLLGDQTVYEPHSFDAEVVAREGGREHRFRFSSYENRVTLAPEQLETAGISVATAAPATIREHVTLNGRVAPNEDALAHVMPRFPGVVRSVHKRLGDSVARGDLLVVVESNESLHPFELRAQLAGTVIAKDVSPGEFVSTDRELFQIADLSTVWVDLDVYRRDFGRLRVGQPVRIDAGDGSAPVQSTLTYLSPIGSVNTQTLLARAVLPNPDRSWRPGLFVTAEVEVGASPVPVAVSVGALQRLRDWDVVFIAANDVFEAQPVELGRRDATHVEIVSGLTAGQGYVAVGSFVLKADAGKSVATHDH